MLKTTERERAAMRGLEFIYGLAREPEVFAEHGSDLVNCFYFTFATSPEGRVRRAARRMGVERARAWRREFSSLPAGADADTLSFFIHGSYAADRLVAPDPGLREEITRRARSFGPRDVFGFDPVTEAPPSDVPAQCTCGEWNARGRRRCRACRAGLEMTSRYLVWYTALMRAYNYDCYGVACGASYADVLRWLPAMRPYRGPGGGENTDFYDTVYAVTHVVYTLNHYNLYELSPRWLPDEFAFLKAQVREAISAEDPEMLGEIVDSLKAFGLTEKHPLVSEGMEYLLSAQNADGSWGPTGGEDVYARYHSTWTAFDGLRPYTRRVRALSFPRLKPLLTRRASGETPLGQYRPR
jgi:hypothetical protein